MGKITMLLLVSATMMLFMVDAKPQYGQTQVVRQTSSQGGYGGGMRQDTTYSQTSNGYGGTTYTETRQTRTGYGK